MQSAHKTDTQIAYRRFSDENAYESSINDDVTHTHNTFLCLSKLHAGQRLAWLRLGIVPVTCISTAAEKFVAILLHERQSDS